MSTSYTGEALDEAIEALDDLDAVTELDGEQIVADADLESACGEDGVEFWIPYSYFDYHPFLWG